MNPESQYCSGINSSQTDQNWSMSANILNIIFAEFEKLNQMCIWKYNDPRIGIIVLRKIRMWKELTYQISRSIVNL